MPSDLKGFTYLFKCTSYKYAKSFVEKGEIKFGTPQKWVEDAKKQGEGRGDAYEGVMAFAAKGSSEFYSLHMKYSKELDYYEDNLDNHCAIRFQRDMSLPCCCFYLLKNNMFHPPKEKGIHQVKTTIGYQYFRDFADNLTPDDISKLEEEDRPAIVIIRDYKMLRTRFLSKLREMGLYNRMIESEIAYKDYNYQNEYAWYDSMQQRPNELLIKREKYFYQNELRWIINTRNERALKRFEKPICVGNLSDIAEICDHYCYDGISISLDMILEKI